jgi:hypothetical protein
MADNILSPATERIAALLAEGEATGLLSPVMVAKLRELDAARQAEAAARAAAGGARQVSEARAAECARHVARIKQDGYTVVESVIPPERVAAIRAAVLDGATPAIAAEAEALGVAKDWKLDPRTNDGGTSQVWACAGAGVVFTPAPASLSVVLHTK